MHRRDTPPTPLWDGEVGSYVLFDDERFMAWGFPSREGIKGCVTGRGAVWAEELRDTVSRGLVLRGVIRQASGDHFDFQVAVPGRDTPPPFSRGEIGSCVLFGNERFEWGYFPS